MVLEESDVISRVNSPLNLFNKLAALRESTRNSRAPIVSIPPTAKEIIPNLDDKLTLHNVKGKAISIMNKCMDKLDDNIELMPVKSLGNTVKQMGDAIKALEPEDKKEKLEVQFIVYQPELKKLQDFQVIEVSE